MVNAVAINVMVQCSETELDHYINANGIVLVYPATASFYVRDAGGNSMSVYERTTNASLYEYRQKEAHIYGSSRIGQYRSNILVLTQNIDGSPVTCLSCANKSFWIIDIPHANGYFTRSINKKVYELSDQLGNMRVTFSDQKLSNGAAQGLSYSNYYAFGSPMPGRTYNSTSYRYGFNGKEKVDEMSVAGGDIDFGARIYDSRLGRWLSVDPQFKMYPYSSPYVSFGDNPIYYIDPGGETLKVAGDEIARAQAQTALQKLTNDKVEVLVDGTVKITAGNENPDKKLNAGTALIKHLVESEKTGTIEITTGDNETASNAKDNEQGVPADATIRWNPNSLEGGTNENGEKTRPVEIGLAHEMIHALFAMWGKATDDETIMFGDPDDARQDANWGIEEYNTRLLENVIRKEQGLPLRLVPNGVDTNTGKDIDNTKPFPIPEPVPKPIDIKKMHWD